MAMRRPGPGAGDRQAVDLDPRRAVEKAVAKHPELVEGDGPAEEEAPEKAVRSDATSYDRQPAALREVLERSFPEVAFSRFAAWSDEKRSVLVQTYNRMVDYGIWGHVRVITSIADGEKPVDLGLTQLHVAGKSVSVLFEVYDRRALLETMLGSGRFGKDTGLAGLLHPGQTSMREWSTKTEDGLHLSIGAGTEADSHLDRKSPTKKPKRQTSQMDLVKSIEHHWQEVWPEFLRLGPGWLVRLPQHVYDWLVDKSEFLGVGDGFRAALKQIPKSLFEAAAFAVDVLDAVWAGTTFKPGEKVEHPDPTQREEGSDIVTVKEYRFGEGKGRGDRKPVEAPKEQSSIDARLATAVDGAVAGITPRVLKPARGRKAGGSCADVGALGQAMAGKIVHQAKANGVSISLQLGESYDDPEKTDAAYVKEQLSTIGQAVRAALLGALESSQAKDEAQLAEGVRGVKSGWAMVGGAKAWFALH